MLYSGIVAIATSGSGNTILITNSGSVMFNYLVITNEGSAPGFFSVDGGNTWGRIPASGTVTWRGRSSSNLLIKRDGGTDMSNVYAFADWATADH